MTRRIKIGEKNEKSIQEDTEDNQKQNKTDTAQEKMQIEELQKMNENYNLNRKVREATIIHHRYTCTGRLRDSTEIWLNLKELYGGLYKDQCNIYNIKKN